MITLLLKPEQYITEKRMLMNKVAVIQSNYIPWKGYFDIINDVDLFVFYDNVQYTNRDWRNRNKVKVSQGTQWLTVPVQASRDMLVCDVTIASPDWGGNHYKTLLHQYAKAPYFKNYKPFLEYVYLEKTWESLSELNQFLIRQISVDILGINTKFEDSRKFQVQGQKLDRLVHLVKQTGAELYVSGPAAKDYIDQESFSDEGIALVYKDYSNYPEYSQFHPPFEHYVSILDLLFHTGPDAPYYIWGWREDERKI